MMGTDKEAHADDAAEGAVDAPGGDSATHASSLATVCPFPTPADDERYRTALAIQRLARLVKRLQDPDVTAKMTADDRRLVRAAVGVIGRATMGPAE